MFIRQMSRTLCLAIGLNFSCVLGIVLYYLSTDDIHLDNKPNYPGLQGYYNVVQTLDLERLQRIALDDLSHFPHPAYYLDLNRISSRAKKTNSRQAENVVPKIVHFIWFRSKCNFRFHQFISLLSAHKHVKPDKIYLWHDNEPCGKWWERARNMMSIEMRKLAAPRSIFGHRIVIPAHQADVARLEIMKTVGGIYMDLDVVALRSWDDLLRYNITLGTESLFYLNNGVILARPATLFVDMWYESYMIFKDKLWNFNSLYVPMLLARKYPHLINVEHDSFHTPPWYKTKWLYEQGYLYDFSESYAVHLWYRLHNMEHNPDDIKTMNTTMGQLFRYIYYGSTDIIQDNGSTQGG